MGIETILSMRLRPMVERHTGRIIKHVYELRKIRGDSLPATFEQTVQQAFERHCGDSDNFCGKATLNLFTWPKGKWTGTWGLNKNLSEKGRL